MGQTSETDAEHASIHDRVVIKEKGLETLLSFDEHQRVSFNVRGHSILPSDEYEFDGFVSQLEQARLFDDWQAPAVNVQTAPGRLAATMNCAGFELSKSVAIEPGGLSFECGLRSTNATARLNALSIEFNLSMLTDTAPDRWLEAGADRLPLDQPVLIAGCQQLRLCDAWQGRRLVLSAPELQAVACYPVYTASSSEGGFERTYQGSCIMLLFSYDGAGRRIKVNLALEELDREH